MLDFLKNEEKKVEYIELIYDLIFVYMIGRNNSLVHAVSGGFLDWELYLTYVICTLITIQIWYSTTLFINRYGDGSIAEYIGLFINMYLLYYMASGTQDHWMNYYYRYNVAWILILLNIMVQYLIKKRQIQKAEPWKAANVNIYVIGLLVQAAAVAAGIVVYALTGFPATPISLVVGFLFTAVGRKRADLVALDFMHLTERVMLFIVFTFGEMIIAIASYFDGTVNLSNIFYSAMGFLIVVGLFMSYGFFYDRVLDREMQISGDAYMVIHIFIIFALSNITNALELMREPEVDLFAKSAYITISFAVYYIFLFMLAPYTKYCHAPKRRYWRFALVLAAFLVLMGLFYRISYLSIAISAGLTFGIWYLEYRYWKEHAVDSIALKD